MAKQMPFRILAALVATAALSAQAPPAQPEALAPVPGSCHEQRQGLPPMGPGAIRGGDGRGPMGGPMGGPAGAATLRFLDLTTAQSRAVKDLLDRHKPAMTERHKALMAKETALREALEDPAATEPQLRALAGVASAARLQVVLEQRAVFLDIQAVLSPDQQAKAERLRRKLQKERIAHEDVLDEIGEPKAAPGLCPGL